MSIDATLTSALDVESRAFVVRVTEAAAAMMVWVIKGTSLLFVLSILIKEAFLFVEPGKIRSVFGFEEAFVVVWVIKKPDSIALEPICLELELYSTSF